jgi:hypothetical protein
MRARSRNGLAALVVIGLARAAAAQDTAPVADASPAPDAPPGRFRLGPVYLTPSLRLGTIGLDTNVFYTPEDRRTDVTASGGPVLEAVLPFGESGRASLEGGLDYVHFLRTASQRKLNGLGGGSVQWKTPRSLARIAESFRRTYGRIGFEVDRRVLVDRETTVAELERRLFGRLSGTLVAGRGRFEVEDDDPFLGVSLRRTLSERYQRGGAGLEYALTVKTSVVAAGEYERHRFPFEPARDGRTLRLVAGLRTDATALVAGHALLGVRRFALRAPPRAGRDVFAPDLEAMWNVSPRTSLGGHFARDLAYSAFAPAGTPTQTIQVAGLRLDKELTRRLDLRLFARRTRFETDGPVEVVLPDGERVRAERRDSARELGADLGWRVRPRLRAGVVATYTTRRSTIAYFGIDGLMFGGTLAYTP